MKLALVLGIEKGNVIKNKLNGIRDNLVIDSFNDIPTFISTSMSMHSIYDRILVISNLCNTPTLLSDLYNYWATTSKETEVVLMCQKGKDQELAESFMSQFRNPVTTAILLDSTTMKLVAEAVTLSIDELTKHYGISDFLKAEFADDTIAYTDQNKINQAQQMLTKAQQMLDQGNQMIAQGNATQNMQLCQQGMQLCNQAKQLYNEGQQLMQQAQNPSIMQQTNQVQQPLQEQEKEQKKGLFGLGKKKHNQQENTMQMQQNPMQNPMQMQQNPMQMQQNPMNPMQMQQSPMQNPIQNSMQMQQNPMQMQQNPMQMQQSPMQMQQSPMQNPMQMQQNLMNPMQMQQNPMQMQQNSMQDPLQMQEQLQNQFSKEFNDDSNNIELNTENNNITEDNFEDTINTDINYNESTDNSDSLDDFDLDIDNTENLMNDVSNINDDTDSSDLSFLETSNNNTTNAETNNFSFLNDTEQSSTNTMSIQNENSASPVNNFQDNSMQYQNNQQINSQSTNAFQQNDLNMNNYQNITDIDNDFASDKFDTDAIFNEVKNTNKNMSPIRTKNIIQQDVDEIDFSNLDIASADADYRRANESQNNVRVVTKEVIRNIGNVSNSIGTISNIYAGRLHKVVVVTGDRGTGITSTALSIAKYMSNKVPILYFDCDVDNHGLLSYINYDTFRSYEKTHMEGIKRCRSSHAFYNCVVSYDNNFDILTTDYSCDTEDEELITAQGIVAEKMSEYGVVVVDCPVDKIHLVSDLILTGTSIICVDATKRGFMNMLCQFENSKLDVRYKRSMVSKGTMFLTKYNKGTDLKKLIKFVKDLYEPEDVDWLSIPTSTFFGALNDEFLNSVFEA